MEATRWGSGTQEGGDCAERSSHGRSRASGETSALLPHFKASPVLISSTYFCSGVGFLWDREICVLNVLEIISMGAREPQRELELGMAMGGFGDEKRLLRESSEEMNMQRPWGREGEACGQGM